jgi:hypothetical protein
MLVVMTAADVNAEAIDVMVVVVPVMVVMVAVVVIVVVVVAKVDAETELRAGCDRPNRGQGGDSDDSKWLVHLSGSPEMAAFVHSNIPDADGRRPVGVATLGEPHSAARRLAVVPIVWTIALGTNCSAASVH